jgi:hypothetical protein
MTQTFTLRLIGVCIVDYLTCHHYGDRSELFSVGASALQDADEFRWAVRQAANELTEYPWDFQPCEVTELVSIAYSLVNDLIGNEYEDEETRVWILLSW